MTLSVKDRKQLAVVAGLLLIFVIASKDSFGRMKKSQERLKRTKLVKTFAQTGTVPSAMTQANVPTEAGGVSGTSIDPFSGRPITIGIEAGPSGYNLSGIVFNPKDRMNSFAIINNRPCKVGDTIPKTSMKIIDVTIDEVILTDGTSTLKLKTW